jgi:hypothetical protein
MRAQPRDPAATWEPLRRQVAILAPQLSAPPPGPGLTGPAVRRAPPSLCATCRGPACPGHSLCYQCALHSECLPGLLADVVVPIAYATKGGEHARNLCIYKSGDPGGAAAASALRALLVVFLRDHGRCAWRSAGMAEPTHVAVVPSGRGRCGRHSLRSLAAPYLRIWPCPGRVCRCGVLMIRKSATSIRSGSGRGGCPARVYCCLTTPGRQGRARRAQRLPSRSRARARSQSSFWGGTWPRRPRGGQLPHSRLRPCRSVPGFAQSTSRLRRLSLCPLTPHRGPRWSGALVVSTASSR